MMQRIKSFFYFSLALWFLSSCSSFERIRKSNDVNYKLTKANEYFDKKDYTHANELYKDLMPIMKSTRNYENLCYKYSFTFFYLKDYLEGSYHFKNFTETFPGSKHAEECEYMSALCLFKYAPKQNLDQTNTNKALEALQSYVNRYPKSDRTGDANKYISEAKAKLELKEADAAKLYFNINQFKAATVAYKSVLRDYPESANCDLYQFMIMKSFYKFASKSIAEKQEERFSNAIAAFNELKSSYPHSKFLAQAEQLNSEAEKNINKIRNEHH